MIPPELHTPKTETQKPILGEHYSHITKYVTTFTIWKSQYYFLNFFEGQESIDTCWEQYNFRCYSYELSQGVILK